jgi:hypothetical protein
MAFRYDPSMDMRRPPVIKPTVSTPAPTPTPSTPQQRVPPSPGQIFPPTPGPTGPTKQPLFERQRQSQGPGPLGPYGGAIPPPRPPAPQSPVSMSTTQPPISSPSQDEITRARAIHRGQMEALMKQSQQPGGPTWF